MRRWKTRASVLLPWLAVAGFALAGLSCGSDSADPTGPVVTPLIPPLDNSPDLVVSDPVQLNGAPLISAMIPVRMSSAAENVSYVSIPPGSQPEADSAEVRNWTRDLTVGAPMTDGGLDPIAIPAAVGDTLLISTFSDGAVSDLRARTVPERNPPVIVRSDPPRGKTRVPLNSVIVIVFSEPLDGETLTPASVRLQLGTQNVGVALNLSVDGLSVEVVPDSPLEPSSAYTLIVSPAVADLSRENLESQYTSSFTTVDDEAVPTTEIPPWSGTIALLSNRGAENGSVFGPWSVHVLENSRNSLTRVDSFSVEIPYPYHAGPQLSPDDTRIAFLHYDDVWLMNADGSGLINLTSHGNVWNPPVWSPDGSRIAYDYYSEDLDYIGIIALDGADSEIQVGSGFGRPDWSPDGTRIVFQSPDGLEIANADGSGLRIVVGGTSNARHPRWSPDGSRIVFQGMGTAIQVVNADGSGLRTLIDPPGYASRPQWSPDGSKIAFLRRLPSCGWPCVLTIMDSAGGNSIDIQEFKDTPDFHLIWPFVWSPDGSRLAFSVRWYPIDWIYMINSDGTDLHRVIGDEADPASYIIGSWVP